MTRFKRLWNGAGAMLTETERSSLTIDGNIVRFPVYLVDRVGDVLEKKQAEIESRKADREAYRAAHRGGFASSYSRSSGSRRGFADPMLALAVIPGLMGVIAARTRRSLSRVG